MEKHGVIQRKEKSIRNITNMVKDGDECGGKSIMEVFDDHILTEILLNLPVKMKLRCKAVCKRLLHLISTPFFEERVLARVSMPWYLLYRYAYDNWAIYGYKNRVKFITAEDMRYRITSEQTTVEPTIQTILSNFLPPHIDSTVYAAHNGLILCSKRYFNNVREYELYVCNPLTGERVFIPDSQICETNLIGFMVSCNNGSTSFKVVRVQCRGYDDCWRTYEPTKFEVFSSDVGEWRRTGVAVPKVNNISWNLGLNGVVHDGKFFWSVGFGDSWIVGSDDKEILDLWLLAYDPDKNECQLVSFKVTMRNSWGCGLLGTSCGHLCYANYVSSTDFGDRRDFLSVCVLEIHETKKCKPLLSSVIELSEINQNQKIQNDEGFSMMPLAFHPFDMEIVYYELRKSSENRIVSFNIRTKQFVSFIGEEISEGLNVRWPVFLFVVPSSPTPLRRAILDLN